KKRVVVNESLKIPSLTLIVAAYNEEDIIEKKIENTLSLSYPPDKIHYTFVTDGSSDTTPDKVKLYPQIKLMHLPERNGKVNAMHRAMQEVSTDVVVFTDANALLNQEALLNITRHYTVAKVGAVSGEKRVHSPDVSDATAGEGFYWKYESLLKKWDSELFSVVGAAGELFSIRTELYTPVPEDTILDDFMISLKIASLGYTIAYEPASFAVESSSVSIREELKRKVRIAAGGIQSIGRLTSLFNFFKHPVLSFQFISHRVLRWTITPFCLFLAFFTNIIIIAQSAGTFYQLLLAAQVFFYTFSFMGWAFEKREMKVKLFFIPYYFCLMNYTVLAGIKRYFSGKQSAVWEKALRK
ncbi:MAG TPA: glycosyltransferase family 2 protein, partial [Chitinophagaceae bacterium]|nr:glycosyltransferase family 2 protein [Chitinophagaceae bacterium]